MSKQLAPIILILLLLAGCGSVSDTRPDVIRKGEYYLEHGVTAYGNSDYVTAADFFSKALAQYRSIDNTHGILLARINLAETAMATGDAKAVLTQLDEGEKVARRTTPPLYLKRLQLLRAQVYWREGKVDQVRSLIAPLLPKFDKDDEPESQPDLLMLTAITLQTDIAFSKIDKDTENAKRWLKRLEASLQSNGESTPLHEARVNRFKAQLAYRDGNTKQAISMLDEALKNYREATVRPAIAATLTETAKLYIDMKQWDKALERLQRALYIRVWIMDRTGTREVLQQMSMAYDKLGDQEKAKATLHYAQSIKHNSVSWSGLRGELLH